MSVHRPDHCRINAKRRRRAEAAAAAASSAGRAAASGRRPDAPRAHQLGSFRSEGARQVPPPPLPACPAPHNGAPIQTPVAAAVWATAGLRRFGRLLCARADSHLALLCICPTPRTPPADSAHDWPVPRQSSRAAIGHCPLRSSARPQVSVVRTLCALCNPECLRPAAQRANAPIAAAALSHRDLVASVGREGRPRSDIRNA